jgi:hypothetical protein
MLHAMKNLSVKATPKVQTFRPRLEALEERCLLSGGITTPTGLVNAIVNANKAGGATTITLASGATFDFSAINNTTNGGNALPVITANITIVGNGDIIGRQKGFLEPFRFFDVASGGSLSLENLTLQGGLAEGQGTAAEGGAIFSNGALLYLNDVTVQNCEAEAGSAASPAYGGGIFYSGAGVFQADKTVINANEAVGSNGSYGYGGGVCVLRADVVSLENDTFNSNQAIGMSGANGANGGNGGTGGNGGWGLGGGLYVSSSTPITLIISNDNFSANEAIGGKAGNGGNGLVGGNGGVGGDAEGGGLYVNGSNLTLNGDTFRSNSAVGGAGGNGGNGTLVLGAAGGNGGSAFGGGVFTTNLTTVNTLLGTTINQNTAAGGAAGAGTDGKPNGGSGGSYGPQMYGNAMTLSPTSPLPSGTVGTAYNQAITAGVPSFSSGTSPSVTYSPPSSSLGLQFNTDGSELIISGTPTAVGNIMFNVTATDSEGSTQPQGYLLTIYPSSQPPAFTSPASTTFVAGSPGTFTIAATGFPAPSLAESGTLPTGIVFKDNGNGTATLGGTAAVGTQGTYHLSITAQNIAGSITQSFTLTVNPSPVPPSPPALPPPPTLNVPPLLAFFDSLLAGVETINANGTETITDYLLGFPLLVATFDDSGNLVSVDLFGIDVTFLFG